MSDLQRLAAALAIVALFTAFWVIVLNNRDADHDARIEALESR